MSNIEKYNQIFVSCFESTLEEVKKFQYKTTPAWDSIGHMILISAIEESFDIVMETEDILTFHSYEKGLSILSSKYHILFDC